MKPMFAARQSANSPSESLLMSSPSIMSVPLSALSMPAIKFSSVDLPEPDGPINATKSPRAMLSVMPSSTGTAWPPRV